MDKLESKNAFSLGVGHLSRIILVSFLLTFMLARIIVFLIMSQAIPDLYLYVKGTHVHHLNYGIFLLSGIGAYLLFSRPVGRKLEIVAGIYGVAMAMTFDEFGMWIHLGGSYWQRASWDAVVVISSGFALIAFIPTIRRFHYRHWLIVIILILALIAFILLFFRSFRLADKKPKMFETKTGCSQEIAIVYKAEKWLISD
jgi:hypothetical protein